MEAHGMTIASGIVLLLVFVLVWWWIRRQHGPRP